MVLYQPQWITSAMINSHREKSGHGSLLATMDNFGNDKLLSQGEWAWFFTSHNG